MLAKRKEDTDQKIEALNQRITGVQAYFEEQKAAVLKYVDDRGEELTRLLNQFKVISHNLCMNDGSVSIDYLLLLGGV
ncbi:hypothetical protein EON65_42650 [archaeon]|nr:MAG: hypothetical protein EON65_42650 [archaeon]